MSYNILKNPASNGISTIPDWDSQLKEQQLEVSHDQSMLTLANPDEALIVVGPPRLATNANEEADFHIVGMIQNMTYSEQSQVQPMKAVGSRRHVFARTNQPVQGNIQRLMFLGPNMYRALYQIAETTGYVTKSSKVSPDGTTDSAWYANLEEDLFRIPFGLGVIYRSPASNASSIDIGADYLEVVSLVNRNVSIATGQTSIMEQVAFMADRVIPWPAYQSGISASTLNPAGSLSLETN